jgi:excisionase family DNA binding protein
MTLPDELTSTIAASMLGVSRSTLMKLHNEGEIDSRRVGSHHRFRTDEVLGLLERRRKTQRRAFDALRELDEMLDPHDSPE